MTATAVCLALSGVVVAAQETSAASARVCAGANTPTLSGCVARGASTGTYTLTSHVKRRLRRRPDEPATVALIGTDVDLGRTWVIVSLTGSYLAATEPPGPTGTAGTRRHRQLTQATTAHAHRQVVEDDCRLLPRRWRARTVSTRLRISRRRASFPMLDTTSPVPLPDHCPGGCPDSGRLNLDLDDALLRWDNCNRHWQSRAWTSRNR